MSFLDSLRGNPKPNKLTLEANQNSGTEQIVRPLSMDKPVAVEAPTITPTSGIEPTPSKINSNRQKYIKIVRNAALVVFTIIVVLGIATFTSMDTIVMKPYLTGQVVSGNVLVAGAEINLNGRTTTTDASGNFSLHNLEQGTYELVVTATKFEKFSEQIVIDRTFLNYQNYKLVSLAPSGIATLTGKFTLPDGAIHSFVDDRILLEDTAYKINLDGSFRLTDVPTGELNFNFQSDNFQDIIQEIKLTAGENSLPAFTLAASGDLVASTKSFLKDNIVTDLTVLVEGVPPAQVKISDEGELRVRDLEIGREYRLQIQHPGYVTRQHTVKVAQGRNEIFGFKVVEKGLIPYLQKVDNYLQVFVSDLDGGNPRQLTQDRFDPYAEYVRNDAIYFLSSRDNVHNELGGKALIPYVVSAAGGNPQRITTNTDEWGRIVPNFAAQMLANVRRGSTTSSRILEVMNLEGTNRKTVFTGDKLTINDIDLSANGEVIAFTLQAQDVDQSGLYRAKLNEGSVTPAKIVSKQNLLLYDVSDNGDRLLYTTSTGEGVTDLYMYTVSTGQDTLVRPAMTGSNYQFKSGQTDQLLFFDQREGSSNMYLLNLKDNSETRLTAFSAQEGVEAVYQHPGLILYQTNRGLYVMDQEKLLAGKLVTNKVARFTGYDF